MDMSDVQDYEKYAYPLGHAKARETRLIPKKHMMEFAALDSLSALLKGLEDTDYGPFLTKARESGNYEEAVERAFAAELDDLTRVIGPRKSWVVDVFRIKYDLNNFKILFKSKFAGKEQASFSFFGTISPKKLKSLLSFSAEEILKQTSEPYRSMLEKAIAAYKGDTRVFDYVVDREMFAYIITKIPDDLEGAFFREYFSLEIDVYNLITYLRLKREGKEASFSGFMLSGGTLRKERIENLELAGTACGRLWDNVKEEYESTGSLTKLERLAKAYLMRFVHDKSLLRPFAPESVAAYALLKEQEALNIRLLLGLKAKQVPAKLAKELIGEEYA